MQLLFFLVYIFEAIIAFIYYSENYSLKRSNIFTFSLLFGLYIIAYFANILDHNTNYINAIIIFLINLIFSKVCFDISIKSSIFHSSFLLVTMFLTELVTEAGTSYFLHIPIDAYKNSISALIIIGIISKIFYLFVCKLVSSLFSYKIHSEQEIKNTYVLFIYPIMITATLMTFLYASTKYSFSKGLNLACVIISIVSLVFCCFIFIYNRIVQQQQNELITLQSQNQKNELNNTFYRLLEQKNEEQRVLVHDMKHHLYAINSLSTLEEVNKYIKKLKPNLDNYQFIGNSQNKMLDLILSKYSQICADNNISFSADVRKSNLSFMEDNDLASLLGNLLDNAVEAAKSTDNAMIKFIINRENHFVIISMVNSSFNEPVTHNNKIVSTKTDSTIHGYGIKSIEKTVEKYDGVYEWSYDKDNKEFHFNILFNR